MTHRPVTHWYWFPIYRSNRGDTDCHQRPNWDNFSSFSLKKDQKFSKWKQIYFLLDTFERNFCFCDNFREEKNLTLFQGHEKILYQNSLTLKSQRWEWSPLRLWRAGLWLVEIAMSHIRCWGLNAKALFVLSLPRAFWPLYENFR